MSVFARRLTIWWVIAFAVGVPLAAGGADRGDRLAAAAVAPGRGTAAAAAELGDPGAGAAGPAGLRRPVAGRSGLGAGGRDRLRVAAHPAGAVGFNVALFANARAGSWRERIPKIFIEIARLILVIVGLALLFRLVWGADVGGVFAALGVTSIVIGLALQNAVGGVISGLLLLFEQPFKIGDWLTVGGGERSGDRGQLACRAHRHRHRHPDHPELDALGARPSPT